MTAAVPNLLLAGVLLASMEIVWVLVRARSLFLSLGERLLFALASSTGVASCVLLAGLWLQLCTGPAPRAKPTRMAWALLWTAVFARLFWSLSDGRRVKDLAARPFVV